MQNATIEEKPRSVAQAVLLIWLTLAASATALVFADENANADALVFNFAILCFYALVNFMIARRRHWARLVYSVLIALEVALLLAFGLEDASDLDVLVTCFTFPLEVWSLVLLFGASADQWFKLPQTPRSGSGN
jgi:hypothetical protein